MKMKSATLAGAGLLFAGSAIAYAANANMRPLSKADCVAVWSQITQDGKSSLSEADARRYVKDFKAANPDGDKTLEQAEWLAACDKGLVHAAAADGEGPTTGSIPSPDGKTSDRTPDDASPAREHGSSGAGAPGTDAAKTPQGTSDRTPPN